MPSTDPTTSAATETPLSRRGLLHGSTHARDHDELLALLESMHQTHIALAVMAALALVVAAVDFVLAVAS